MVARKSRHRAKVDPLAQLRRSNFKRLAEPRVNKAIWALRQISYLGNRNRYDLGPADIELIVRVLKTEVEQIETKLASPEAFKPEATFTLDA